MAGEVPHHLDELSVFQQKYKIPWINADHARWDKRWEQTLRKLSASEDVFPILSPIWTGRRFQAHRAGLRELSGHVLQCVARIQKVLLLFGEEWASCIVAWLLLDKAERKHHLFNGMKVSCQQDSLHYDGRALCPEITTSAMLRQNGKAFTAFTRAYVKGIKEAGAGNVYLLPSKWWSSAVNMPEPWPEDVKFAFAHLSLQRNEFISHFIAQTMLSILDHLCAGSSAVDQSDQIRSLFEPSPSTALTWARTFSCKRDKPLIRCQNCSRTPQEIEVPKFMVCGPCKSELNFVVHYCSRTCQKEDWSEHKKHCGKDKIAKKLPGTIHNPSWEDPATPDYFRLLYESADDDGTVDVTDLGFGTPDPSRPPAFRRQLALLEHDRDADYFLFDDADHPVRFLLTDTDLKTSFRIVRAQVMFTAHSVGAEILAEYLIKMMGGWPGLSRAGILAQFEREYGGGVAAFVAALEARAVENGYEPGGTYFEAKHASMRALESLESLE